MKKLLITLIFLLILIPLRGLEPSACVCLMNSILCKIPVELDKDEQVAEFQAHEICPNLCNCYDNFHSWDHSYSEVYLPNCLPDSTWAGG